MIELAGVHKIYETPGHTVMALRDVDLTIRRGEFVSVSGPSGAGKSTLLNLLGCLDLPSSGRLTFDGQETNRLSDFERARLRNRAIGFVFQTFNLIRDLTVLENVELPLVYAGVIRGRRQRATDALARVGLAGLANRAAGLLSGGEQQRAAIARAVVNEPELILADEPTGSVDARSGKQVLELLEQIHLDGGTIVLVTHNPTVGAMARRALRMVDGSLRWQSFEDAPSSTPAAPPLMRPVTDFA